MALYPGYGVRNEKYEVGEVIVMKDPEHPGSDQDLEFYGKLPYPFAPPVTPTNPPVSSFEEPNPVFPNPEGIPNE